MSDDTPTAAPERIELPGGYSIALMDQGHWGCWEILDPDGEPIADDIAAHDARAFAAAIASQPPVSAPVVPEELLTGDASKGAE